MLTLVGAGGPRRGTAMRELGMIQDGAVLIVDGKISHVGPARRVERLAEAREAFEIDASGKVVMPGFVDCNTQLLGGPARMDEYESQIKGYAADAREMALDDVRLVRGYSKQRMELEARKQVRQIVRHGTTTLDAKSGCGLDEATELKALRVLEGLDERPLRISRSYFGAAATPRELEGNPEEYVDWLVEKMLPTVKARRLSQFVDVACGTEGGFTAAQSRRLLATARALGFAIRVQTGACAAAAGAVGVALDLQATSIDGLTAASEPEIAALSAGKTIATLLPGRTFQAGQDRQPPARALIDAGVAVALGTGFDGSASPSCSVPMMMSLACSQMRMTPAEAVTAATHNAACVLGAGGRFGSLEWGKEADLILLQTGDYRELSFRFGMNLVAMVIRQGEQIFPRLEMV